MRPSPQRHPLAVLRTLLGISQKELATLLGCSTPTIQAIELCKLSLSEKLAKRIAWETGVSLGWLLGGDPTAPITTQSGRPYIQKVFEIRRAEMSRPKTEISDSLHAYFILHNSVIKLTGLLLHSYRTGEFNLCAYKISTALDALVKQFGAPLDWGNWPAIQHVLASKYITQEIDEQMGIENKPLQSPNLLALLKETQALLDAFHRDFLAAFEAKRAKLPPRQKKTALRKR